MVYVLGEVGQNMNTHKQKQTQSTVKWKNVSPATFLVTDVVVTFSFAIISLHGETSMLLLLPRMAQWQWGWATYRVQKGTLEKVALCATLGTLLAMVHGHILYV